MAGSEQRYTVKQVSDALKETKGMVYLAADRLGCVPQTVYNYIERHPTLKALHKAESERVGDLAELQLYNKLMAGDLDAVKFYLRTKGKHRGYVERQENTGADGADLFGSVREAATQVQRQLAQIAQRHAEHATNGHSDPE